MPRSKSPRRFTLLLPENVEKALEMVTVELGLDDASSTIRFLIRQRARELGVLPKSSGARSDAPESPPTPPAKRRSKPKP